MEEILQINEVKEINFNNTHNKGLFISFEGGEGSGKSTQIKLLSNDLSKNNLPFILTREPGGTKSAESIWSLILKDYFNKKEKEKFDIYTDTLLYLAARNEHIKNKIKPALKKKTSCYLW